MRLVTKADIDDAANRISGAVLRTPLVPTTLRGRRLWLKPENLQAIGAFKVRAPPTSSPRCRRASVTVAVVAYSQRQPRAGRRARRPARRCPGTDRDRTTQHPRSRSTRPRRSARKSARYRWPSGAAVAAELAEERGATLIPPFDHPGVIAGQGTIGLEILADLPDADVVLVPVSGGGLAAGIGVAIKAVRPRTKVYGGRAGTGRGRGRQLRRRASRALAGREPGAHDRGRPACRTVRTHIRASHPGPGRDSDRQ